MTNYCQNGLPVLSLSQTRTFLAPNGKLVYTHPNAVDLMAYVTWHWHRRIEPLKPATYKEEPNARSGYVVIHAWRPGTKIMGTNVFSNHGSGTAMDVHGEKHPYEYAVGTANYHDGFTASGRNQLRAIKSELARYGANLKLGIDFASPRRDAMHVEFWNSPAELASANKRLRAAGWAFPKRRGDIAGYQRALGIYADDHHGTSTTEAVKAFQRRKGLFADGYVGNRTLAKLNLPAF